MQKSLYLGLEPPHSTQDKRYTHCPIIKIVPRNSSQQDFVNCFKDFSKFSHIIFTSKNVVSITLNLLKDFNIPLDGLRKKILIAIGSKTASYLLSSGLKPDIVAEEESAEGIIKELKKLDLSNSHFLWPHSSLSREVLRTFFVENKVSHSECVIYDTVTDRPEQLPDLKSFHEIVFTSPSCVKAFLEVFGSFPGEAVLTAIGPITQKELVKTQGQKGQ